MGPPHHPKSESELHLHEILGGTDNPLPASVEPQILPQFKFKFEFESNSNHKRRPVSDGGRQEVAAVRKIGICVNCPEEKAGCLHALSHDAVNDALLASIPPTVPSLKGCYSDGLSDGCSIATEAGAISLDQTNQYLSPKPMLVRYLADGGDRISGLFAWGRTAFSVGEDSRSLIHNSSKSLHNTSKVAELDGYIPNQNSEPLIVYPARNRVSEDENEPWDLQSGLLASQPLRTPNRIRTKPSKSRSKKKAPTPSSQNRSRVHPQNAYSKTPFTHTLIQTAEQQDELGDITLATPSAQKCAGDSLSIGIGTPPQQANPMPATLSTYGVSFPVMPVDQSMISYENYGNTIPQDPNFLASTIDQAVNGLYDQTYVPSLVIEGSSPLSGVSAFDSSSSHSGHSQNRLQYPFAPQPLISTEANEKAVDFDEYSQWIDFQETLK